MAKRSTTPTVIEVGSFEELDAKLLEFAALESTLTKEEADLNAKMQDLRDAFETRTADQRARQAALSATIERFCIGHKDEFEKSRSRELIHGTVGFRNAPPKVGFLSRKYNANTALELLKRIFRTKYVRTKEEIDKEAILADYAAKEIDDTKLASVGLRIDQDEKFYVDIKWEAIDRAA